MNPNDKTAEAKFKEAAEAYEVLSDSQKRAQYDQFGHVSNDAGGFGGFSGGFSDFDFGDIFETFLEAPCLEEEPEPEEVLKRVLIYTLQWN